MWQKRLFRSWGCFVSVKSKFQHPSPRAYPGHLTSLPSLGEGNLIIRIFQGMGNLNLSLDFMWNLYCKWQAIVENAVSEPFLGKDCAFVANWLQGKGLNKLFAVFEIWNFSLKSLAIPFSQVSADSFRFNIQECSRFLYPFIAFRPTCIARRLVMRNLHEKSTQRAR